MYGLALEGGGAKGAYHMGAIKALLECGYEFGGITGTSIGALNAAVIVQGDFEKGYKLWENLDPTQLFGYNKENIKTLNRDITKNLRIVFKNSKKLLKTKVLTEAK